MPEDLTHHKIGVSATGPALILFYTGSEGLRKRVMPVRGLDDGVEAAARRLVAAHKPFLEAVSFEQVTALCGKLQQRLAATASRNASPSKPAEPKLDRSFLRDIAGELPSPDLEAASDSEAEDEALAAFARGSLEAATFAQRTPSSSSAGSGSEERRRRPSAVTAAAAPAAPKPKGDRPSDAGEGKAKKGGKPKKAKKKAKCAEKEKAFAGLEALLGMSSEDEAAPAAAAPRTAAPGMSSLKGMPALF